MDSVAFFNHKGGVGKTTLVYNVGLALAQQGRRVLFVDADAQANLTSAALDYAQLEKAFGSQQTIAGSLRPLIDGTGDFKPVAPIQIRDNAWLLPGDLRLSEFEEIAPDAWIEALAGRSRGLLVTTAMYRLVRSLGQSVGAEYAFIDLGPNVGAMNRNVILASTGFVVPIAPDLFSVSALPSVGASTAGWVQEWRTARASVKNRGTQLGFELPQGEPAPLGYISQQFAVYRQAPAAAYGKWVEQIPDAYVNGVVEPLRRVGVEIPVGEGKIGEVRNLSSLVPMAQRAQQAVFELSGSVARGAQYTRARDTLELFEALANEIARRLASLSR
jgi:chromosome partitioning protein